MKIGIFYFSMKPGPARQPIWLGEGLLGYIRVETVEDVSLEAVLDKAAPEEDEAVMNTHEVLS